MTNKSLTHTDDVQLVQTYRAAAKRHGEATEKGDHRTANLSARLVAAIYSELRHRGHASQAKLLPLLDDPEPGVRLWSASHALEFSPLVGEAALASLSSGGRLIARSAEMTLKEWRAGRLEFTQTIDGVAPDDSSA